MSTARTDACMPELHSELAIAETFTALHLAIIINFRNIGSTSRRFFVLEVWPSVWVHLVRHLVVDFKFRVCAVLVIHQELRALVREGSSDKVKEARKEACEYERGGDQQNGCEGDQGVRGG